MSTLELLWLPILVGAAAVFVVSFILHMVLPYHRNDYKKVPNEDQAMEAIRPLGIPAGDYMLPKCESPKEMKSPEFVEKMKKGPVLILTVVGDGSVRMGKSLVKWFIYILIITYLTTWVANHLSAAGAGRHFFKAVWVIAFLGYAGALWPFSIWFRRSCATTVKGTIDGIIYGLVTALVLHWLWPR